MLLITIHRPSPENRSLIYISYNTQQERRRRSYLIQVVKRGKMERPKPASSMYSRYPAQVLLRIQFDNTIYNHGESDLKRCLFLAFLSVPEGWVLQ